MYKKLDEAPYRAAVTEGFLKALHGGDASAFKKIGNAFAGVAADGGMIRTLSAFDPMGVSLSGSGPTHFAVFNDGRSAVSAAKSLQNKGFSPYAVPFVNCGNKIVE